MTDKAKMIAEIVELATVPYIDLERDVTAKELGAALRIDPTNVRRKMLSLEEQGLYGTDIRRDPVTQRDHRVWWRIEDGPEISIDVEKDR